MKVTGLNVNRCEYVPAIDGLRAIAVLSVLFFHLGISWLFPGGFVGVDIFFVISGFLITRLIVEEFEQTGHFSFGHFYYRRAKRLFPALFFVLLLSLSLSFLLLTPQHFERFGGELLYSLLSLSNFYFWTESGYFDTSSAFKPLLHTWSLSVEEQFYLIWPVTIVLLLKKTAKPITLTFIFLAAIISLYLNILMMDSSSTPLNDTGDNSGWFDDKTATIFYLLPFRIFEFAIGAGMVWLLRLKPVSQGSNYHVAMNTLMLLGLGCIGYAILSFDQDMVFPSYNALLPCIGTALIIFSADAKHTGVLLRNRLVVGIGLISYSLYLIHWPLLVFYQYYVHDDLSQIQYLGVIIASLLMAVLMYRFIEQPFRRHSPQHSNFSKAAFGLTCALLTIVVIIPASNIWANEGWKWRVVDMPDNIAAQLKDSRQYHIDNYGGKGYGYGFISGPSEQADLVMIGDSHVVHYAHGFVDVLGKEEGKNVYLSSASCLILPDIVRTTPGTEWEKICKGKLENAVDMVNKSPNSVLLIAHSWGFQIDRAKNLTTGEPVGSYENLLPQLDKLKKMIGDHKMIIVGNVPGAGAMDVIGCFSRPRYLEIDCSKILSRKESSIITVSGNKVLEQYANSTADVSYIDPHSAFCTDGYCRSISKEGDIYYSDKYHLSINGSIHFARFFRTQLLNTMKVSTTE